MCFLAPYEAEARLLQNSKADYCIGVDHVSTKDGADIKQFGCDNSENQKWTFETCEGAPCTVNKKSGLCRYHAERRPR